MTLVLTQPSGAAGAVLELQTPSGTTLSHVQNLTSGTAIPDGSYVGQPVEWDGAAYVPLPPGDPLVLNQIQPQVGQTLLLEGNAELIALDTTGSIDLTSGDALSGATIGLNAGASLNLVSGGTMQLNANTSVQVSSTTLAFFNSDPVVKQTITGATAQLQIDSIVAALVAYGLAIDGR